jgi:DNA excision repair protein ERCC-6-like 2
VDVFHGNTKDEALQTATAGRLEILITTYSTYRNFKSALNCVNWDCVVADECHQIKGHNSETAKAMNEINALCRIGLTGTAIQNSYEELWVLLNWAVPGRFGPMTEWKRTISEPLRMGQSHEATLHQLGKARKVAKALVDNLLPPFFLRRMKSLIADQLPKKNDRVIFCPLTETQHQAYTTFVNSDVVQYIKQASQVCDCLSGKKKGWCCYQLLPGGEGWQAYVFSAVNILQKLSNHLAVLIPQGTDPVEKQQKDLTLLKAALPNEWQHLYATRGSILHYSNPAYCGKWKVLKKLLKFWHDAGDKVLVFSHSVRLLRMLRQLFQHTAYNVAYLDGSMTYAARAEAVAEYNADPAQFVFLISTRAGGVGLNITAANKVVVVDPHWNPAWDLQAQDRAYRLGQVRDVDVFRLVSAGTIEEIVYARQVYKQQQANIGYTASTERRYFAGVQNSGTHKGEIFGMDNLFATPLVSGVSSVLEAIVHKTNVAEARAGVSVVDFDVESTQDTSLPASLPSEESLAGFDSDEPLLAASDSDPALAMLQDLIAEDPDSATPKNKSKPAPTRVSAARSDPVQAILAGAGVAYSHVNSEVVGPSRVEAQLSRQAEAAGNVVGEGDTRLFQASDPVGPDEEEESDKDVRDHQTRHRVTSDNSRSRSREPDSSLSTFRWRYRPPASVRRRQFCSMAQTWGYSSAMAFALDVEQWTSAQRRAALDKFYARRRWELEAEEDRHEENMRMQSGTTIADEDEASQNRVASEVAESIAADDGEGGNEKEREERETGEAWTF